MWWSLIRSVLILLIPAILLSACATTQEPSVTKIGDESEPEFVVGFGSCDNQDLPQAFWKTIEKDQPHVWIWLGDNIYADTREEDVLRSKYAKLITNPYYRDFTAKVRITGTWDDHDYGENDAGKDYPLRDISRKLFWDFMKIPNGDILRSNEGVYRAEDWNIGGNQVRLILLDLRSFRDPLRAVRKAGRVSPHGRRHAGD